MRYILLLAFLPVFAFAQSELTETHTAVFFQNSISKTEQVVALEKLGVSEDKLIQFGSREVVFILKDLVDVNTLKSVEEIEYVSPVFTNSKSEFVTYSSSFFVKLKSENHLGLVEQEAEKMGVQVIGANRFNADIIELQTSKFGIDAIDVVNHLRSTHLFEIVSPNLMHTVSDCTVDDPRYSKQWNLKKHGGR